MKKVLLLIGLLLVVGCNNNDAKELVCKLDREGKDNVITQQVIATYDGDKLENIEMKVTSKVPSDSVASMYSNVIQEEEEANYKGSDSVSVNTKTEGDIVSLITNINYRTFTKNDEKAVSIDKDITYDELKLRFEKLGYDCE